VRPVNSSVRRLSESTHAYNVKCIMLGVKVEINRYVDDAFPGFVECKLIDGWGTHHFFVEKVPIVTSESLDASSSYPRLGIIACQIVERRDVDGREVVKIETETTWHVESTTGETSFDVSPNQLVGFD
jgi:hypothetical protein